MNPILQLAASAALPKRRVASIPKISRQHLISLTEAFYVPFHKRIAFTSILKKMKSIVDLAKKAPKLWQRLKDILKLDSITSLPSRLKDLAKRGYQALKKAIHKAFSTWPLKLYTLEKGKLKSFNDLLDSLIAKHPNFKKFLQQRVKPKVDLFDQWLKKHLPTVSKILMVAIFIWIWLNVVEFEWDMKALTEAVTGHLSLSDLLASLPGSALGFMMNAFGFGTFTLLPISIAARILFLLREGYADYKSGKLNLSPKLYEVFA